MLRKIFSIFLMLLVLSGCAVSPLPASGDADVSPSPESTDGSTVPESVQSLPEESAGESDPLQNILDSMTPEEKEAKGVVIQEISMSKLALAGF